MYQNILVCGSIYIYYNKLVTIRSSAVNCWYISPIETFNDINQCDGLKIQHCVKTVILKDTKWCINIWYYLCSKFTILPETYLEERFLQTFQILTYHWAFLPSTQAILEVYEINVKSLLPKRKNEILKMGILERDAGFFTTSLHIKQCVITWIETVE